MKNERQEGRTELICETDAYIKSTESIILSTGENEDGHVTAELDRTVFFPEGGGQKADEGQLGGFTVLDVRRTEGRILHFLDCTLEEFEKAGFREGAAVKGEVDFALRFMRMQMHIAEHLFCGIAFRDFGYDNVGFHLSDVVTFDLGGPLSDEDIAKIEEECNRAVWANVPVRAHFPDPEEVKDMAFRSKLELTEGLRLVEIEGYDLCACCAPVLHTTGEIGAVKVTDSMPHRGGTRITLIAGEKAYKDYVMLHNEEKEMMELFSSVRGESSEAAKIFANKTTALHEENKALKRQITALLSESLLKTVKAGENTDAKGNGAVWVKNGLAIAFYPDVDEVQSREIINGCVKEYEGIIGIFRSGDDGGFRYVFGRSKADEGVSLKALAAAMREHLGGRGGGSEVMIQGTVTAKEEEVRRFFEETQSAV